MPAGYQLTVREAPSKPLLIFDGDCDFCRLWIERWRSMTKGTVEYLESQVVAARFPEIPREQFDRSVVLIETTGEVFTGAEAVYRSLGQAQRRDWLCWSYQHLPGFAPLSEALYRGIASHRQTASFFTRLLWGGDATRPTYFGARRWFLRALGLVYLIAFVSLWVQIDGLIGTNGILPMREFLPAARAELGSQAPFLLPTLCWFDASNWFLHFLCGAGVAISCLLIIGIAPVLALIALFVFYLSLTIAGQTFLSFQWDILLLETGFCAIFFAPLQLWPRRNSEPPFCHVGLFLLKFLLFKLMLMSGVVKLTSGDGTWWDLSALDYHYWTQPLPTVIGWWSDQHAVWFKKFSVAFCLVVEILAPFFLWAPRQPRMIACGLLIFLQIAIALTGNYCFFNLLTIALCLLLIDDNIFQRPRLVATVAGRGRGGLDINAGASDRGYNWQALIAAVILLTTLPLNAVLIFSAFKPEVRWPRSIATLYGEIASLRIVNGYGLFRVMTKARHEIILEGSADGNDWLAYEFKWKPGRLDRAPGWVAPHQPRLDWQMWFAALGTYRENPWLVSLVEQLLKGNANVTCLMAHNPFPRDPPRYIRARLYDYRFTSSDEHRASGAWWKREDRGEYLPAISLDNF